MADKGFPGEVRPGVLTNYQDGIAELLLSNDYECDDMHDGIGRVYRFDTSIGTFIVKAFWSTQNDGYWDVHSERVPKGEESLAWEQAVQEVTLERDEPEEGDYVIEVITNGYQVTPLGRKYNGAGWNTLMRDIKAHMEGQKFWPNVWLLSDHGNFQLLDMSKERS